MIGSRFRTDEENRMLKEHQAKIEFDRYREYIRKDIETSYKFFKIRRTIARQALDNYTAQQQFEKLNDIHNSNRTPVVFNHGSD